jgi:hypothetical protein
VLDKYLLEHLVVQIGTMLVLDHFSGLEVQRLEVHVPNSEDHLTMRSNYRHSQEHTLAAAAAAAAAPPKKSHRGGGDEWGE